MYLKSLEVQGFKSFANKILFEFHDGITGIVGPNGSGKSNISDAIRWVLGEQSPKMLRGGKMEEVIFSGTENRRSRGMAEVTLVIDNTTGILPIDYNEVAITRRMYRSGESEYYLNKKLCRLKDITTVFPATTVAATTSMMTGLNPVESGMLGWDMYFKDTDETISLYLNRVKEQLKTKNVILVGEGLFSEKEFPVVADEIRKSQNL